MIACTDRRRLLSLQTSLVLALVAVTAAPARASMVDIYGLGSRASAMGGAFTAVADDFSAVYYNPAGLMHQHTLEKPFAGRKGIKFDFGYVYGEPRFYIQDRGKEKQTEDYGSTTGPYLGVTFDPEDFHRTFRRKVFAFGLAVYIPVDHLLYYGRYWPEERRYPFFYDYSMRFVLLPGIGVEILPAFSIGVGLQVLARLHTDTTGTVDVNIQKLLSPESLFQGRIRLLPGEVHLGEFEDLTLNLAPIVGIQYRPSKTIRFGFVYRGENYINDFGLTNPVINLGNILRFPQGYQFKFVRFFTPHEFVVGIASRPWHRWLFSVDVGWYKWSEFMHIEAHKPEPAFKDTWLPRLGVEYTVREWLLVRAGYFFYDSPVPEQRSSLTNFLDNDRHVVSVGSELIVADPPGFWDKPLHISLHLQYHIGVRRRYAKVQPDDPYYPGYSFGGSIIMGGIQITVPL